MATTHALTVVKNNCYKAPRLSNTSLPASMKEIKEHHSFSQSSEGGEESGDSLNRTKTPTSSGRRHINKNKNRHRFIQSYEKEDGVSEEQFYENLIKLREEHKKTLKLLETRYHNELKKQSGFQWDGFQKGLGLQEYSGVHGNAHDMEAHSLEQSHGSKDIIPTRPKSPAQDFVKDLSHLTNGSTGIYSFGLSSTLILKELDSVLKYHIAKLTS